MSELDVKALEESVSAWEKKLAQVETWNWREVKLGSHTCPLCQIYLHNECEGCPVYRDTGERYCKGSPHNGVYAAFVDACGRNSPANLRALEAAVKAELEYLRSLSEKEMKGGENERK